MAATVIAPRVIHTCPCCGHRWNPRYVSAKGCPYCRGTGEVIWRVSVVEEARRQKARKAWLQREIEATYEVPGGRLPAWHVFWAFVYHDVHARGTLGVDLSYCVRYGILRKKQPHNNL